MTRNPVVDNLVRGAVERCRERIAAAWAGGGVILGVKTARDTGVTLTLKRSHGL